MVEIILLAMVAVFVGLRLFSVLGQRTGHEQEPRKRQQPPVATLAVVVGQEEAADLARPVVLLDQVQRLDLFADAQHLRLVHRGLDAVGVERLEPADL